MRFKHIEKTKLKEGQTRTIKKFLWLPLRLKNETRWMEFATINQETYNQIIYPIEYGSPSHTIKWINKSFV